MSAPVPLPGFLNSLAPLLDHWGYLAVGGLLFLEDFGVPVPGETVLIAASVYAGAGRMNIVGVALIAFAAAVLGDNLGYAIGRLGGRALVLRFGKYVFLTEERLARAEGFFTRHGGKIVTVARFIEGLRQANGIIAGLTRRPWLRFLAFNVLGAALWVGTWSSVGYLAGNHITTIYNQTNRYALYLLAAAAVLIVALVVRHRLRRRRAAADGEPTELEATTDPESTAK
jgi:membrane protein DedA with SNARE-associated domain